MNRQEEIITISSGEDLPSSDSIEAIESSVSTQEEEPDELDFSISGSPNHTPEWINRLADLELASINSAASSLQLERTPIWAKFTNTTSSSEESAATTNQHDQAFLNESSEEEATTETTMDEDHRPVAGLTPPTDPFQSINFAQHSTIMQSFFVVSALDSSPANLELVESTTVELAAGLINAGGEAVRRTLSLLHSAKMFRLNQHNLRRKEELFQNFLTRGIRWMISSLDELTTILGAIPIPREVNKRWRADMENGGKTVDIFIINTSQNPEGIVGEFIPKCWMWIQYK